MITTINLWKYQDTKTIRITDVDGNAFLGALIDITDSEEFSNNVNEDAITIAYNGNHIQFMQSEIKSIQIID